MTDELRELVEKIARLESEQEVLKLKLQELESEQSVYGRLFCLYIVR